MYCGGGHLEFSIGIKSIYFVENLPMIIPWQFGFNFPSGFREEAFRNIFLIVSKQLKPNSPGMIIGRSSTKFLFYMSIGNPR
jgi:hypothetical protein